MHLFWISLGFCQLDSDLSEDVRCMCTVNYNKLLQDFNSNRSTDMLESDLFAFDVLTTMLMLRTSSASACLSDLCSYLNRLHESILLSPQFKTKYLISLCAHAEKWLYFYSAIYAQRCPINVSSSCTISTIY